MKRFILPTLVFALFAALPAFAVVPEIINGGVMIEQDSDALTGANISVELDGPGAKYVYCDWTQGNSTVRVYLAEAASGTEWVGILPAGHAGKAAVFVYVEDEDGNVSNSGSPQEYDIEENTTDARGLSNQRYPDFTKWALSGAALDNDWAGYNYTRLSNMKQMVRLPGAPTEAVPGFSATTGGGFVRTRNPIMDGVGSIWLKAHMSNTNRLDGGKLSIERITWISGTGSRAKYNFEEVAEIRIPPAKGDFEWYQYHLLLQITNPSTATTDLGYFRIRNKTVASSNTEEEIANAAIDIQDIVLTPLIPDVKIVKDELDYSPGYPSILDPIEFHVTVSNLYAAAPAENIAPKLVWRQKSGVEWDDWTETPMTNRAGRTATGPGVYACVLTDKDITDGAFEYFYEVGFTGYTPTFPYIRYDGGGLNNVVNGSLRGAPAFLIATNDIALLMDEDGNLNESRSPAIYPDFRTKYYEDTLENSSFGEFAESRDIVPGTPADLAGTGWDFTRKFELREPKWAKPAERAEGSPFADVHRVHFNPVGSQTEIRPDTIQLSGEYKYLKPLDVIRRFRTRYNALSVVVRDLAPTNARPEWLQFAYPMQNVGDFVWQTIIPMSGAIDNHFSVTGAMAYVEGATSYEKGPFEWIQIDQDPTGINPPMSGSEGENGSHLRRFVADFTNEVSVVSRSTNYLWYAEVPTTALYVGLVTNEAALAAPTPADVVGWFKRLDLSDPDEETGAVTTNAVQVDANYSVSPDGLELSAVFRADYSWTIYYLETGDTNAPPAAYVTNLMTVAESYRDEVRSRSYEAVVTNAVYFVPDEAIAAEKPDWDHARTRVQIDYDGFLMFRFCTTNGSYQIRRAAWQDFNAWQADDNKYSRSFGIYDMQTFESDLEGRDLTVYRQSLTSASLDDENVKATDDWAEAGRDLYVNGFAGKGLRIVKERVPDEPGSMVHRTAILLSTHPKTLGSLETTQIKRGDGRDTLSMLVRSSTDDDRILSYKENGADTWKDYRVVARVLKTTKQEDVSDGEHSLSLVGYYQDPFNYWEARIIQKSKIEAKGLRTWFELHVYEWKDGECEEHFGTVFHANPGGNRGYDGNYGWNTPGYLASETKRATWPGWNNNGNNGVNNDAGYYNNGSDTAKGTFLSTHQGDADSGWVFVFDLKTENGKVAPTLWAWRANDIAGGAETQAAGFYSYTVTPVASTVDHGRPGYNMRDCGLKIGAYVLPYGTAVTFSPVPGAEAFNAVSSSSAGPDAWDHNNKAVYDRYQKFDAWEVTPANATGTSPTIVTRPAPPVYYGVKVFRTLEEETTEFKAPIGKQIGDAPADWDEEWDAYHDHAFDIKNGAKKVESYRWTPAAPFELSLWDDAFLAIQAYTKDPVSGEESKGNLAVRELECSDFRGKTVYDADMDGRRIPPNEEPPYFETYSGSFISTYATIAADGRTGRRYEMNRARANPFRTQAITTPLLKKGVGDIIFGYRAEKHPVLVSVRLLGETETPGEGFVLGEKVRLEPGDAGTMYVPCLSNQTGRLSITVETPEDAPEGALGTLFVDDVRATDYPATGETSWEVYNALVSSFQSSRAVKFDGTSEEAASYRSAVLNDGKAKDTLQNFSFEEHVPFVQTPSIETGVGEISFWYRAAPENGNPPATPAKISLMVADTSRRPDGEWRELTAEDLNWNESCGSREQDPEWVEQAQKLATLKNITTDRWTYFSIEFYQDKFHVLRIMTGDGDTDVQNIPDANRVMLDNVLITEPVRTSIDVGAIEFSPAVPLCTKPTDVTVRLVNPRKNPHDIRVFLDWFVGDSGPAEPLAEYQIPTFDRVVITNADVVTTNIWIDGDWREVHYTVYDIQVEETPTVGLTVLPRSLAQADDDARSWGYEKWKDLTHGSIELFTNAFEGPYVFHSPTNTPIPTQTFDPDKMFQYCVRVQYVGDFSDDVFSETQGKVRNGFWFSNPPWYDPINLNEAFGTLERPVAHAFAFSCTTNAAFINEFRPAAASTRTQAFVELIGPEKADIDKWRLEHFGMRNGFLSPKYVAFTNILSGREGAAAAFRQPYNATTNKGWGFWVLGCSAVTPADSVDQTLFRDGEDMANGRLVMTVPGGLRLRRRMGADVDRIVWGNERELTDFVNEGYKWTQQLRYATMSIMLQGFGDASLGDSELRWSLTSAFTIGGYNYQEEMALPWLDGTVIETRVPAAIEPPVITGIEWVDANSLAITFKVRITQESVDEGLEALAGDYEWTVQAAGDLELFGAAIPYEIEDFDVDSAGGWTERTVVVPAQSDTLFYRVRAESK